MIVNHDVESLSGQVANNKEEASIDGIIWHIVIAYATCAISCWRVDLRGRGRAQKCSELCIFFSELKGLYEENSCCRYALRYIHAQGRAGWGGSHYARWLGIGLDARSIAGVDYICTDLSLTGYGARFGVAFRDVLK